MVPPFVLATFSKLLGLVGAAMVLIVLGAEIACKTPALTVCKEFNPELSDVVSWVAAAYGLALAVFNSGLWATGVGRMLGWPVPDIRGTWKGILAPVKLPPGAHNPGPIPVYLVVRQSAFQFRATLYTRESESKTKAAEFTRLEEESELVYSYHNTPQLTFQHRSPIHWGTAKLEMVGLKPVELKGTYFTDRLTAGEFLFTEYCRQAAHSFANAETLNCTVPTAGRR